MRYLINRYLAERRELETAEVIEVTYGTMVDLFVRSGMNLPDARFQATVSKNLKAETKIGDKFYRIAGEA